MRTMLPLLPLLMLAACSASPEDAGSPLADQTESMGEAPSPSPTGNTSATTGGDGSPIILNELTAADREANPLEGELGCSFTLGEVTLLVAMGDVADQDGHAQALAKIGDYPERLFAREAGGFDGLADGAVFTGKGMTFTLTRTSDTPIGSGESPPHTAELLLQRADGAERVITGLWTCGP